MAQLSNRSRLAFAMVLLVGIAVVVFFRLPQRPGVLAASQTELRLEMKYGAKEDVFVDLKNIGGSSLLISGVSSSCGCTVGAPEANQLDPGKSTRLKLEVRASSIGRKDAVVNLAYESLKQRGSVRIPVVMITSEVPGTRVLSFPKDLNALCDSAKESRTVFEVRTLEAVESEADLIEVLSEEDRCRFRILDVKATEPDRHRKTERSYQLELVVAPSEPFAAIARMKFREPLGAPAGNIVIIARPKAKTRVVPSAVELPSELAESSRKTHEVLLISDVDVDEWSIAEQSQVPEWLTVGIEKLRPNLTRVTIADLRTIPTKTAGASEVELTLSSSAETVSLPVRIRQ